MRLSKTRPLIVDNFAGGGGASTGIEQAFGRPVDIAINHNPAAIAMHEANHPDTFHYCEDVFKVDPVEACKGRPVGFAWFSPDCFHPSTMILTEKGYVPIQHVKVGDLVLTHKGRWRPVTAVMTTRKETRRIVGHGHPGLRVSAEHPFWAAKRANKYKVGGVPAWIAAKDLAPGDYWATPTKYEPLPVPEIGGRGMPMDARLWWLVGAYVANGWARLDDERAELVISDGFDAADALRKKLDVWRRHGQRSGYGEVAWAERVVGSTIQFSTNHRGLVAWLIEHFGHKANKKKLPGFVYGLSEEHRAALLLGYTFGDGYTTENFIEPSTVSRGLVFGLKCLVASLGMVAGVYDGNPAGTATIEGRVVNTKRSYRLRWRHKVAEDHKQHFSMGGHVFTPIRKIKPDQQRRRVCNLSVEEDESYVAEGVVVHNCTHFSQARGSKPVKKQIRGLAWVVLKWARAVKPQVIALENVREFETWGKVVPKLKEDGTPVLDANGEPALFPCPINKGKTFQFWVARLRALGYQVEWRTMNAADYGAPTHRRRLFLIARCDGLPIAWPQPTHGPGRARPYRTAAENIDWSIPCQSIFLTPAEAKVAGVRRPLAEKTLRRIGMGLKRFVLDNPRPFIVSINHGGGHFRGQDADAPLSTVTGSRGFAAVTPTLVSPFFTAQYGERPGQQPRAHDVDGPLPVITPRTGGGFPLIEARCVSAEQPLGTITRVARPGLVAASLIKFFGGVVGQEMERPLPTVTSVDHSAIVAANMIRMNHGDKQWNGADQPLGTVLAGANHHGLVKAFLTAYNGTRTYGQSPDEPIGTVVATDRFGVGEVALEPLANLPPGVTLERLAEVAAFLREYAGVEPAPGVSDDDPGTWVAIVAVEGVPYVVADIGLRMLKPRELFRCQGFPPTYVIDPEVPDRRGRPSRLSLSAQVEMVGNSVSPVMSRVIASSNIPASMRSPGRAATAGVSELVCL